MTKRINGIQQLGVGVNNVKEAFAWYRKNFGMDIKIFEEAATAELMLPHTEGKTCQRHAILALNMQGGGGFEIWQHTGKTPISPTFSLQLGDLGINIGKLKSYDLEKTYTTFKKNGIDILTEIAPSPIGVSHFYAKDIFGNIWEICHEKIYFSKDIHSNGGVYGAVIGTQDIDKSLKIYKDILNYDQVLFDGEGKFNDWIGVPGCEDKYRRVILTHRDLRQGAFSPMFGPSQIELVEVKNRTPRNIFEGRIWGDPGFIHLCFDINGLDELREEVKQKGFPFTVDSENALNGSFDMGEAAGSFAYIQAPEGTLIEFVETHKIPIIKKIGLSLNLKNREEKPLPHYIFKLFKVMRVK